LGPEGRAGWPFYKTKPLRPKPGLACPGGPPLIQNEPASGGSILPVLLQNEAVRSVRRTKRTSGGSEIPSGGGFTKRTLRFGLIAARLQNEAVQPTALQNELPATWASRPSSFTERTPGGSDLPSDSGFTKRTRVPTNNVRGQPDRSTKRTTALSQNEIIGAAFLTKANSIRRRAAGSSCAGARFCFTTRSHFQSTYTRGAGNSVWKLLILLREIVVIARKCAVSLRIDSLGYSRAMRQVRFPVMRVCGMRLRIHPTRLQT